MMKVIDLTHVITETIPVYPGTPSPYIKKISSYCKNGFVESSITITSHTGTHMDAPAHIYEDGLGLEGLPMDAFLGSGVVIDCRKHKDNEMITMSDIKKVGERAIVAEYLLFLTGWDLNWGKESYYSGYPYFDMEVVNFIINTNKKGIGIDTISVDPEWDSRFPRHKALLKNNQCNVIENLTHIDKVMDQKFIFCAFPLKFENSDGAPVRAVAIIEE